jgi:hypothetical protein
MSKLFLSAAPEASGGSLRSRRAGDLIPRWLQRILGDPFPAAAFRASQSFLSGYREGHLDPRNMAALAADLPFTARSGTMLFDHLIRNFPKFMLGWTG